MVTRVICFLALAFLVFVFHVIDIDIYVIAACVQMLDISVQLANVVICGCGNLVARLFACLMQLLGLLRGGRLSLLAVGVLGMLGLLGIR